MCFLILWQRSLINLQCSYSFADLLAKLSGRVEVHLLVELLLQIYAM